jgi:hypothetical protein
VGLVVKINLGFEAVPYPTSSSKRAGSALRFSKRGRLLSREVKRLRRVKRGRDVTAADVGESLETKYHIVEVFTELLEDEISEELLTEASEEIQLVFDGEDPPEGISQRFSAGIEELFRDYIANEDMAGISPGVPTKAALAGKSRFPRFAKHGRGVRRPSFDDTGIYQSAFRAWVD